MSDDFAPRFSTHATAIAVITLVAGIVVAFDAIAGLRCAAASGGCVVEAPPAILAPAPVETAPSPGLTPVLWGA